MEVLMISNKQILSKLLEYDVLSKPTRSKIMDKQKYNFLLFLDDYKWRCTSEF